MNMGLSYLIASSSLARQIVSYLTPWEENLFVHVFRIGIVCQTCVSFWTGALLSQSGSGVMGAWWENGLLSMGAIWAIRRYTSPMEEI